MKESVVDEQFYILMIFFWRGGREVGKDVHDV